MNFLEKYGGSEWRQTAYFLIVACGSVNTYKGNVVIQYSFFCPL